MAQVEALAPSVIREEQALKSLRDKLHEEKTAGLKLKADWQENKDKKKGLQEDIQKVGATLCQQPSGAETIAAE